MPSLRPACRALLASAFAGALFAAAVPAHADSYSITGLTIDNKAFYGMDDSGDVVFNSSGLCSSTCYATFHDGISEGLTATPPALNYDYDDVPCNAPCSVTYNGRTVTASHVPDTPLDDLYLYALGDPPQFITQVDGLGNYLVISGSGDIVFDGGTADEWYEAFDLTTAQTPEPSSLLLLATGIAGIAAFAIRRRFVPSA